MAHPVGEDVAILPAPPELEQAALELVFRDLATEKRAAHVGRLLTAARSGRLRLDLLLVALRGTDLVGAIWAQKQPGRAVSLWPPAISSPRWTRCAQALVADVVRRLERSDVRIAQSLLACNTSEQAESLRASGFAHMADLLYMVSLAEQFPTEVPQSPLVFDPFDASHAKRLGAIVERTYEGTLDCPQLNGVRKIDDVLASYRACGVFDAARWFIVRREDRDVGCLLLTDHPDENQWEIVYAGSAPPERGRGLGPALVRHAQWLTGRAQRARLVLAVDAANAPAVTTYQAAGFTEWDRRAAFLRVFPHGGSAT